MCSVSPSGFAKLAYTVQADTDTGLLRFDRDKRQVWGQWAWAGHREAGRGWGRGEYEEHQIQRAHENYQTPRTKPLLGKTLKEMISHSRETANMI